MKLSFKSFWGETFMALPNLNFWSDDDPEYAPHKYMLFFGWLCWGVRFYFGTAKADKKDDKPVFEVKTIYNKFRGENRYVIIRNGRNEFVGRYTLEHSYEIARYNDGNWYFLDQNLTEITELTYAAIRRSVELTDVVNHFIYEYPILAWKDDRDACLVCDLLNREAAAIKDDNWKIVNLPFPSHVLDR